MTARPLTLQDINRLDEDAFVQALGWVYEDSPWVARRAWPHRPYATTGQLAAALAHEVDRAPHDERLTLIRAHPDLGARARMADASRAEQAGAGLTELTPGEHRELTDLNATYTARFGHPFILAVKGKTKHDILASLRERLSNEPDTEFDRSVQEIHRIAGFRLTDIVTDAQPTGEGR